METEASGQSPAKSLPTPAITTGNSSAAVVLERDPALRDALRRHILTDELLQVPVRLERIEEDIGALKEGQARLEEGQARLEQKVDTVDGHVSRLTGTD